MYLLWPTFFYLFLSPPPPLYHKIYCFIIKNRYTIYFSIYWGNIIHRLFQNKIYSPIKYVTWECIAILNYLFPSLCFPLYPLPSHFDVLKINKILKNNFCIFYQIIIFQFHYIFKKWNQIQNSLAPNHLYYLF